MVNCLGLWVKSLPFRSVDWVVMFKSPHWYHATRGLGVLMVLYGLLVDHTPERGSIIIGGLGLLGYDLVKRSDPPKE